MPQEYIEIRGARENNLKNVSLRIPKRKITIFTGVSGSGKSSIVFDTIANEAQRLLNENFSLFIRNFLPRYPQPEADAIENLSMAVVVDQKRLGGGSHSTVGTVTDIYSILRRLFWRIGQPFAGSVNVFSFNDPQGMCPNCNGLGRKLDVDLDKFLDTSKSLNEGALLFPDYAVDKWDWSLCIQSGLFDADKKLSKYTKKEMDSLLYSEPMKIKTKIGAKEINLTFQGILEKFASKYIRRDIKTMSERTQKAVAPYMTMGPCSVCGGGRLSQAVLKCKINDRNIAELANTEITELIGFLKAIQDPIARPIVNTLVERLQHLVDIGLEYLNLNRETDTLSGGESQRIKIVKHLSSSLMDVTYVFDEPSTGMHPRDVHRMNELLQKLRDKGNTVIVVEHDPDVIKVADHIVDVGPRAGRHGGEIVFEGSYKDLLRADTLTGKHIKQNVPLKGEFRKPRGKLSVKNAKANNLQNVSVDIPTGVLTVVTGVAGSGKSSLINRVFLQQHPDAIVIDQSAVGASSRSNPATYTGIMDDVRKAFATANKVSAALFSFNSKGACDNCQGLGVIYTDLAFLSEVKTPCEVCGGKRFKDDVLAYKLKGKSISDVLAMNVQQALEHFELPEVRRKLQAMSDVGLDYLSLGQPLSTLSGGECQRIKLASELHKKGSVYVMDEPTTGLHMSDIGHLLGVMNRLVDTGNTVIVIEHNLHVIKNADWIIDIGPEGGSKGGTVMFEGTPRDLQRAKRSLTSAYIQD
ncbi:thiamine abc transporter permease : Excinuclease ATPase subunit OS=Singulisphaera acidiphila (strain ATCC BAA-1392 / DSM 18658 / VKM B-2454 / MOB10) GN=Sinac_4094 PE=3 SV=1: ABC_tran [Gemmata massiliana]|uniref:UvrABC system protein A n=1 Tax=Gemmata massiliana TaxID=1210884 RepID=A0A6P2D8Z7_9BACT|nr:excinuclease ABC subunit UvrA [Gemmata massiliana]VTR96845.1 thiamine abc transporter permease : Excinuclease ATPase subunit OS=Singulisphaera acidiphila (strain ATCC BAA-1392 / DSM 18658 / VKM B-2454 / MOB10) GN=Sinac_4094 PE=3 SV=1: ABC_tran [Gemmata massiliana]